MLNILDQHLVQMSHDKHVLEPVRSIRSIENSVNFFFSVKNFEFFFFEDRQAQWELLFSTTFNVI